MQYDLAIKALIIPSNIFAYGNVIASKVRVRTVGTGGAGFSSEGACAAHPNELDGLHRALFRREKGKLIFRNP